MMRQTGIRPGCCLLIGMVLVATSGAVAQPRAADLKLPVPRTFDLTHVEPTHYAVALGKDPVKIFEFLRDAIGYELYTGALRGPRGTLLAWAGNSVDRAALLAGLLEHSGQKTRFARGALPEARARELVVSMWADRSRPPRASPGSAPSPSLKAAADALVAGVRRDYQLLRAELGRTGQLPAGGPPTTLDALANAARDHYWVQWWKDGRWVDLDPSFRDAAPGRANASAEAVLDTLPEALYHRVTIRVRLEEHTVLSTGAAAVKPSVREILSHTARAADLSGAALILSHQPENWQGPVASLQRALASAITNTGRVKPVLTLGPGKWITGQPFRQKLPTGGGIGGLGGMLGGEGTRNPVSVGTAEFIEVDFVGPDGHRETVVRELFDRVGKARRATGKHLTAEEVRRGTAQEGRLDVTRAIYSLAFTTGRVDVSHVQGVVDDPNKTKPVDTRTALHRLSVAFTVISDALSGRIGRPDRAVVLFYPDSPRLIVAEASVRAGARRLAFDLRRDHARAVMMGPDSGAVPLARMFRGVLDGTLERVLLDAATAGLGEKDRRWSPNVSTSEVFDRAQAERVPALVLPAEIAKVATDVPDDAMARLREEMSRGYIAVAPQRPFPLGGAARFAWWRIDPRSGESTAVTDDGLHQVTFEFYQRIEADGRISVVEYEIEGGQVGEVTTWGPYARNSEFLRDLVAMLERHGGDNLGGPFFLN